MTNNEQQKVVNSSRSLYEHSKVILLTSFCTLSDKTKSLTHVHGTCVIRQLLLYNLEHVDLSH